MTKAAPTGGWRSAALASALALGPAAAAAQGLVATENDIQYRYYLDSGGSVISGRGSAEYEISPGISVQGDLILGRINDDMPGDFGDFQSITIHGIYDMGGMDAGAFVIRDFALGDDYTTVGIEGRFAFQGSQFQPWLSYSTDGSMDVTTVGVTASSRMAGGIGLDSSIIHAEYGGVGGATDIEFEASYAFPIGAEAYASAGYLLIDEDFGAESEATLGIGLRFDLGGQGGTTFGSRSLYEPIR